MVKRRKQQNRSAAPSSPAPSEPAAPTTINKVLLAAAALLEFGWLAVLVTLALLK